jgi:hypothetical protein
VKSKLVHQLCSHAAYVDHWRGGAFPTRRREERLKGKHELENGDGDAYAAGVWQRGVHQAGCARLVRVAKSVRLCGPEHTMLVKLGEYRRRVVSL